jgi:hypothetical protein
MITLRIPALHRRWVRLVVAATLPCLLAGTFYGLAVQPVIHGGKRVMASWNGIVDALGGTVQRSHAIAGGSLREVAVCAKWIEQRVPATVAPAAFLEELQEIGAELGIERFEYHSGTARAIGDTGYRADPIEVRIVAPYAALLAFWQRIEPMDRPLAWTTLRLRRYGGGVAATFVIELLSRPAVAADGPAGGVR